VLVSELDQLPPRGLRASRQEQRDYLALWAEVLSQVRPDVDSPDVRIHVLSTLGVVNNVVRTRHVSRRPDISQRLFEICRAILLPASAA